MFLAAKTLILYNCYHNKKLLPGQNHGGAVIQVNYHFPQISFLANTLHLLRLWGNWACHAHYNPSNWIIIRLAPNPRGSYWTNIMLLSGGNQSPYLTIYWCAVTKAKHPPWDVDVAVIQVNYHFLQISFPANTLRLLRLWGNWACHAHYNPSNWIIIRLAPNPRGSYWTNIMLLSGGNQSPYLTIFGKWISRFYRKK